MDIFPVCSSLVHMHAIFVTVIKTGHLIMDRTAIIGIGYGGSRIVNHIDDYVKSDALKVTLRRKCGSKSDLSNMETILDAGLSKMIIVAWLGDQDSFNDVPAVIHAAKGKSIETVSLVTMPSEFEGTHAGYLAQETLACLRQVSDRIEIISREQMFRSHDNMLVSDVLNLIDEEIFAKVRTCFS